MRTQSSLHRAKSRSQPGLNPSSVDRVDNRWWRSKGNLAQHYAVAATLSMTSLYSCIFNVEVLLSDTTVPPEVLDCWRVVILHVEKLLKKEHPGKLPVHWEVSWGLRKIVVQGVPILQHPRSGNFPVSEKQKPKTGKTKEEGGEKRDRTSAGAFESEHSEKK